MKLSTKWVKHCNGEEEVKTVYQEVLTALPAFKVLKGLIEEEIANTNRKALKEAGYENSSWAYQQADCIGEERAYLHILKLLSIKIEE